MRRYYSLKIQKIMPSFQLKYLYPEGNLTWFKNTKMKFTSVTVPIGETMGEHYPRP